MDQLRSAERSAIPCFIKADTAASSCTQQIMTYPGVSSVITYELNCTHE